MSGVRNDASVVASSVATRLGSFCGFALLRAEIIKRGKFYHLAVHGIKQVVT